VLKHLYNREERWDLAVTNLPANLRQRALHAGCELLDRVQRGSEKPENLSQGCAQLVQADHEAYYRPAYMHSISSARQLGHERELRDSLGRLAYVGDNGVLVIATDGTEGRPARVLSAYRICLPNPEHRTPREFIAAAVQKWRDKTALAGKKPRHAPGGGS
jgi:hypothetical protein